MRIFPDLKTILEVSEQAFTRSRMNEVKMPSVGGSYMLYEKAWGGVEGSNFEAGNVMNKGYKVHFTETCEADEPHLIVDVITTAATTPDGEVIGELHD
jgi:hypothetical protein